MWVTFTFIQKYRWLIVDMVETKGYTLEEVALAFDGSSSSLALDVEATNYQQNQQQTEDSDSKDRHDVK
jgi:hypothetical protein